MGTISERTTTPAGTVTYVYDAAGQLTAEYSNIPEPDAGTQYLTQDHLGSTRLVTNASGAQSFPNCTVDSLNQWDYFPFGGQIPNQYAYGNRDLQCNSTTSGTLKFTGKERDAETGLDYFEARYYSSAQGRFTNPDPFIAFNLKKDKFQSWISDPQHWNKYAYVLNNPMRYVDPSGMTETIYYWLNSKLTDEQKKFFQDHKQEILGAIADKLNAAGIKDVQFKDGADLSASQVHSILSS